jgi:hypothetical protein
MLKKTTFASCDGTSVVGRLDMSDMFYIYEIYGQNYYLAEKIRYSRSTERCHDESNLEKAYEVLKDCDSVFTAKIGQVSNKKI